MKDYTVDDPKFSEKITITEITDTNHADNINKAPKQVFENTLFLKKSKVSADGGDVSDTVIQSAADVEDEYPIPAAGDTPKTLLGKTKKFFESIKNWMTGVCLLGHIVNNCVTDRSDLPLSAAQGKALMDAITVLNTNQQNFLKYNGTFYGDANTVDQSGYWQLVERNGSNLPDSTESHYGTFINFITQYPLQIVALAYFDTHVVYIRIKRDNTWSSWKEI